MADPAAYLFTFLWLSSIQLLGLGLVAEGLTRLCRVQNGFAYRIFLLALLCPLFHPFPHLLGLRFGLELLPDGSSLSYMARSANLAPSARSRLPAAGLGHSLEGEAIPDVDKDLPAEDRLKERLFAAASGRYSVSRPAFSGNGWMRTAVGIWLFTVLLFSVRLLHGGLRLRKTILAAETVKIPWILKELERCTRTAGLGKTPRLLATKEAAVPMLTGLIYPKILLPLRFLEPRARESLRFCLHHELAHLRRRDLWWLPLELLIGTVYFFHPLVHHLKRRIREERERLCDAWVVRMLGGRADYADFLLRETWNAGQDGGGVLSVPLISRTSRISRRIRRILVERTATMSGKIRDVLVLAAVLLAAVLVLTTCRAPSEEIETGQEVESVAQEECPSSREEFPPEEPATVKVLVPETEREPEVFAVPIEGQCSIEGEVLDERGNPIQGAKIHLSGNDYDYKTSISVDDQGRFKVENLQEGWYSIEFNYSTGDRPQTRYIQQMVESGSNRIVMAPEENGSRLFGRVLDPDGNAVPDCYISADYPAFHPGHLNEGYMATSTDEEGQYSFDNIPAGTYHLRIFKEGAGLGSPAGNILLEENEMRSFHIKINPGWARGKIKIKEGKSQEAYGFRISANRKDATKGPDWSSSWVAPDGTFEIRNLPPGEYVTRFYSQEYLQEKKVAFTVPEGREPVEIEIPVIPAARILFEVKDGEGNPRKEEVGIARVTPGEPVTGSNVLGEKISEGQYIVKRLKPGLHRFVVDVQGVGAIRRETEVGAGEEARIEIKIDPPPVDRDIVIETQALVSKDPFLYYPLRPMLQDGLQAASARKDGKGELRWLKLWEDFGYNEEKALLWLLVDASIDREKDLLLLKGIPYPRNIFFFHRPLEPGTVAMVLEGRQLIEGEGFIVNYKLGKITILDPEIDTVDTRLIIRSDKEEIRTIPFQGDLPLWCCLNKDSKNASRIVTSPR